MKFLENDKYTHAIISLAYGKKLIREATREACF